MTSGNKRFRFTKHWKLSRLLIKEKKFTALLAEIENDVILRFKTSGFQYGSGWGWSTAFQVSFKAAVSPACLFKNFNHHTSQGKEFLKGCPFFSAIFAAISFMDILANLRPKRATWKPWSINRSSSSRVKWGRRGLLIWPRRLWTAWKSLVTFTPKSLLAFLKLMPCVMTAAIAVSMASSISPVTVTQKQNGTKRFFFFLFLPVCSVIFLLVCVLDLFF